MKRRRRVSGKREDHATCRHVPYQCVLWLRGGAHGCEVWENRCGVGVGQCESFLGFVLARGFDAAGSGRQPNQIQTTYCRITLSCIRRGRRYDTRHAVVDEADIGERTVLTRKSVLCMTPHRMLLPASTTLDLGSNTIEMLQGYFDL